MTWFTGPTFVQALPPLLVLQVLVLAPDRAALRLRDRARDRRPAARLLGGLLWVIAPFAAIPLFVDRYHESGSTSSCRRRSA